MLVWYTLYCGPHIDNSMDTCSEDTVRVGNASRVTIPAGSKQTYTGRVEICHNGEYIDVCNDTVDPQLFADAACDYSNSFSTGNIHTHILMSHHIILSMLLCSGQYNII